MNKFIAIGILALIMLCILGGYGLYKFAYKRGRNSITNVGTLLIDTSDPTAYGLQLAIPDMETIDYIVHKKIPNINLTVVTGDLNKRLK